MNLSFADLVDKFMYDNRRSLDDVVALSLKYEWGDGRCGMSKSNLRNWRNGIVTKPRHWEEIVVFALALELDETQTNQLLQATGHSLLAELRVHARAEAQVKMLSHFKPPPFQAPRRVNHFVGRADEIAHLKRALLSGRHVQIHSVRGMGGVGKTALAIELAHQLRHWFADGVLWGQLNQSDTMSILASFAAAFERDVSVHTDVAARAAAVRNMLQNKRVLMILDNAQNDAQVKPLLPIGEHVVVLITTRHSLAVLDDAFTFNVLPFDEQGKTAREIFALRLGERMVEEYETPLQEIAERLGQLPLAVAIAAGTLARAKHGTFNVALETFLHRIRTSEYAIMDVQYDDECVRVSFDASYELLPRELQEFFIALGAFGGIDFSIDAAAYIAQVSPEQAQLNFIDLENLSLVRATTQGRYTLHRLLRAYARGKMRDDKFYVRMVQCFVNHVQSLETDDYGPLLVEQSNLVAALERTEKLDDAKLFAHTIAMFNDFLLAQGMFTQAEKYLRTAQEKIAPLQDLALEQAMSFSWGAFAHKQHNNAGAMSWFEKSLELAQRVGDNYQVCRCLNRIGGLNYGVGQFEHAEYYLEQARMLAEQHGLERLKAIIHSNLGFLYHNRGLLDRAEECLESALIFSGYGKRNPSAYLDTILGLGQLALARGDWERAQSYWCEGIELCQKVGHQDHLAGFLGRLGFLMLLRGELGAALEYFTQDEQKVRELNQLWSLGYVFAGLGEVAWRQGNIEKGASLLSDAVQVMRQVGRKSELGQVLRAQAALSIHLQDWRSSEEQLREALALLQAGGTRGAEAEAMWEMAQLRFALGEISDAFSWANSSLAIFRQIGHFRTIEVEAWLAQHFE